ncbi:tetratricopeptide repeat protein [Paenibacillus sp. M1]|uniref:Tetratricopeptide repeat protein n=1 Tax=Paenibacillus haidiansis TaxID=1574488 RepID=A0ABU7VXC9_9BACL
MNPWTLLGIDKTNDLTMIKRAYSRLLKQAHPEEDPEGFQRLREAYEAARRIASAEQERQSGGADPSVHNPKLAVHMEEAAAAPALDSGDWAFSEPEPPEETASRFLRRAAEIYDRFASRIDAEVWHLLLDEDTYSGIEVRQILRFQLLNLLMDRPWLPQRVWRLFNQTFGWTELELELAQYFPERFVQHVMWQITGPLELRYDHLVPSAEAGADIEAFFALRDAAYNSFLQGDIEYTAELLAKAGEIVANDPDTLRLTGRLAAMRLSWEEAALAYGSLHREVPEEEDGRLGLADALLHLRRPEEAEALYRSLLEGNPEHQEALYGLAQSLNASNREAEARSVLKGLLIHYPEDLHARSALFAIDRARIENIRRGIVSGDRGKAAGLRELAELYLENEMYEACLETLHELEEAGELTGKQWFLLGTLGYAWEENGDARIPYLNQALQRGDLSAKDTREALYVRAEIYYKTGKYEESKADLLAYLTYDQGNAEVYYYLGEIERVRGRYEESIRYCRQAIGIQDLGYYHGTLARSYRELERFEDAAGEYRRTLAYHESGQISFEYGEVLKKLGRYGEAADMFRRADQLGGAPDALYELAYAYYLLQRYGDALEVLEKYASAENPTYGEEAIALTGDCHFRLRNWSSASACYNRAADRGFAPGLLRKLSIVCLLAARRFEEAYAPLQSVLEQEPDNEWAQLQTIRIYAELKRWWNYDKLLEKYLETFEQQARSLHIWFYGGLYFYHLKQYKNALKMFNAGYVLGLRGDTCSYLSLTYDSLNQWPEAAAMAREALESRPDHPDYRERLLRIEAKLQNKKSLLQKWGLQQVHTTYSSTIPLEFPDLLEEAEIREAWPKGVFPDDFFTYN